MKRPEAENRFQVEEIRAGILAEMKDLNETAQAFGWERIKNGSWFNQFLNGCLKGYHDRVIQQGGVNYLRSKYPGLPIEAVAGKLCEMAELTAAIAGSLSGSAASGAVLTAGAGIPVAIAAVMTEVLFTIRLQLRLVYDLHLVYGIPLDASDPEELLGLFAVVYGVKVTEVGGIGTKALGPEVMRAQLYRLIHGNTKAIQAAVRQVLGPRIARKVTQKAILKTAVPIVGVAISTGWNFTATRLMGSRVRQELRIKAGLREEALRLHAKLSNDEEACLAVIEGLLALAIADGDFDDLERDVYLAFLHQLRLGEEELSSLASRVHADLDGVVAQLRGIEDDASRKAMGHCFCLIAAADGELNSSEKQVLTQLLAAIGQSDQLGQAEELCSRFRKEEGAISQTMGAVSDAVGTATSNFNDAVGSAASNVSDAVSSAASSIFRRNKANQSEQKKPEIELDGNSYSPDATELRAEDLLQKMAEADNQFSGGEISKEEYQAKWSDLKTQISNILKT